MDDSFEKVDEKWEIVKFIKSNKDLALLNDLKYEAGSLFNDGTAFIFPYSNKRNSVNIKYN